MNKIIVLFSSIVLLLSCKNQKVELLEGQVNQLQTQLDKTQETNTSLLDRMADLSVINKSGAESIKESLVNLNRQNEYIQDLTEKIHQKDSINFALVTNLKRSLLDQNDTDIQVEVRGSAVYVSIADEMLFQSGSADLSNRSKEILSKVASVINDHEDVNVLIEGHTDDVPIKTSRMNDNWDLSVLRATAVVRELQTNYYVEPQRLTAAGRSSYEPRADNETRTGRSQNRRTEIIITPRLDQFFELLQAPELLG
ncbi:MAG: OmpA family protein [Bacteroidota bacterium]